MSNEAFVGPLPAPFESVLHFKDSKGYYQMAYIDRVTCVVHPDDPRLRNTQLPEPWEKLHHANENELTHFGNGDTGKATVLDPRLTANALRARGVELEMFDLI
ncbi:uncharacterized protein RSE6_00113 [Rhynchosporium secalis]|uniref:Uncharacterized protein n=1 Tax=Rhynchosporium secalis TaxID=38038 RepID=A0A1E1LUD5_RHYSE|nr:uncharacterized protein RSE6_00113 [Rhynchosporium secalis]